MTTYRIGCWTSTGTPFNDSTTAMMPMNGELEMARRKLEPGQYSIPDFIRVDGDRWCIATRATVAAWRKAQQVGTTDDAKHTLLQFRAATQMLELAQEYDLPDDAVVLATLGLFNGTEDPDANLSIVEGADGIWRNRRDLEWPKLSLVENSPA